jgi:hypothetical protein
MASKRGRRWGERRGLVDEAEEEVDEVEKGFAHARRARGTRERIV